jgi:hypothetical protein
MNTDWIRPGVKAVVTYSDNFPQLIGEVVTIERGPHDIYNPRIDVSHVGVALTEKHYLDHNLEYKPNVKFLKPYHEPGSWDELQKAVGWSPEKAKTI